MKKQRSEIITLEEVFCSTLEPEHYIVDRLLTPGLYILGGAPKIGKSWLCLQLCLTICQGFPFLGRECEQGEVLYLCMEDSCNRLHRRAKELVTEAPGGLYLCLQANPIGNGLETQLTEILREHPQIKLVVVDTLQKVRSGNKSGSAYAQDYAEMAVLKEIADEHEICLLAVHHLRKMNDEDPMNRLSGTTGLTGCADGTLVLFRDKRGESKATLAVTGRDIEDQEIALDFLNCRWLVSENPLRDELELDKVMNAILCFMEQEEKFEGSATELSYRLEKVIGITITPSKLSRQIKQNKSKLAELGITVSDSRTSDSRTLKMVYIKQESDRNDGNDT